MFLRSHFCCCRSAQSISTEPAIFMARHCIPSRPGCQWHEGPISNFVAGGWWPHSLAHEFAAADTDVSATGRCAHQNVPSTRRQHGIRGFFSMSKRRKNAGAGYGYMFSGAFAKKADAVKKEK